MTLFEIFLNRPIIIILSALLLLSVGCTQRVALMIGGCVEETTSEETAQDSTANSELGDQQGSGIDEPLDTAQEPESSTDLIIPFQTVYFAFDSSVITDTQQEILQKNVKQIQDNPEEKIQIQGNCDERGTVEYNITLGERRANRVKKYLVNLGVPAERLSTISYGEENPANKEHNEKAWSENRRVDFVVIE